MIPQYIKTPYTAEQLRASGSRISSNNHANGTWRINGKNAMDKHGRIFLSFILNSTYRELNYLRGLLKKGDTQFNNLRRPHRLDKAKAYNPRNGKDAFTTLANCGEVFALQRLITRTDLVSPRREKELMTQARKVKKAIDAKATYGNANQAATESTDAMFDAATAGSTTIKGFKRDLKARADLAERHGVPKPLLYKDIDSLKLAGGLPNGSFSVMLKLKDFRQIHLTGFTFEFAKLLFTDYQNWLTGKAGCGVIEREVVGGAGGTSPGSPTGQSPSTTKQLCDLADNADAFGAKELLVGVADKAKPTGEKCQTRHANPLGAKEIRPNGDGTESHLIQGDWPRGGGSVKGVSQTARAIGGGDPTPPPAPTPKPSFMERAGRWMRGLIR